MKKILVKAYTEVNLGDDLFLKILSERYKNTEFTLLNSNDSKAYSEFKNITITSYIIRLVKKLISYISTEFSNIFYIYKFNHRINILSTNYDAFLYIGGSIFMQEESLISTDDYENLILINAFEKSFIIGANFGPFQNTKYLSFYSHVFRKCDNIVFRDTYSKNLFFHLNNIVQKPDIVFQFKFDNVKKRSNTVGFSIIDLSFRKSIKHKQHDYKSFIINSIKKFINDGKEIYLFSFCKNEGDQNIIENLKEELNLSNLHTVFYDGKIEAFLQIYASMEAMYCTRFHSMILSLIFKQKILPIIYSNKMMDVLTDINYDGPYVKIDNIEKEDFIYLTNAIYNNRYTLPSHIKEESEKAFENLDIFLKN